MVLSQHQSLVSKFPPSPPLACVPVVQTPVTAAVTFQIFRHRAGVPGALHGDLEPRLLCSPRSILAMTILPGAVLLPGTF